MGWTWGAFQYHVKYEMYKDATEGGTMSGQLREDTGYCQTMNELVYNTPFHHRHTTTHRSVFMLQCSLARMEAIDTQDNAYNEAELRLLRVGIHEKIGTKHYGISLTRSESEIMMGEDVMRYISVTTDFVNRAIAKFVCI